MSKLRQQIKLIKGRFWIALLLLALFGCLIGGLRLYVQRCYPIPSVESLAEAGDSLVFTSRMKPRCAMTASDDVSRVYLTDPDTGKITQWVLDAIPSPGVVYSWSPERQQLLLSAGTGPDFGIYAVSPDGSAERLPLNRLLDDSDVTRSKVHSPTSYAWSPDSEQVAFGYAGNIWIQNRDGTGLKQLTHFGGRSDDGLDGVSAHDPSWSPDGEALVFALQEESSWTIHRMKKNGEELITLTNELLGNSWLPKWSPDGTKIAFLHSAGFDQPMTVWLMNPDGSETKELLEAHPGGNWNRGVTDLVWSPDSWHIAFLSGWDGPCTIVSSERLRCHQSIYRIDIDGTNLKRLSNRARYQTGLVWIR